MKRECVDSGIARIYIRESLEKASGCFLCYLENRFEQRYFDNYLNETVMDPNERERIIKTRGFCNYHFYKIFALSTEPSSNDGLGLALILKSVTEQLLSDVREPESKKLRLLDLKRWGLKHGSSPLSMTGFLKQIASQVECPACDHVRTMMQVYTECFLREIMEDDQISRLFDTRGTLCVPHYMMTALIASRDPKKRYESAAERIKAKQIQSLEKMQIDLSEYISKQDYKVSEKERLGTERIIGESLAKVAGKRGSEKISIRILKPAVSEKP